MYKKQIISNLTYKEFLAKNLIDQTVLLHVGIYILEMFLIRDVFELKYSTDQKESPSILINENSIKEIINNLIIHPSSLPLISQPND
jgi:hypothetical protein